MRRGDLPAWAVLLLPLTAAAAPDDAVVAQALAHLEDNASMGSPGEGYTELRRKGAAIVPALVRACLGQPCGTYDVVIDLIGDLGAPAGEPLLLPLLAADKFETFPPAPPGGAGVLSPIGNLGANMLAFAAAVALGRIHAPAALTRLTSLLQRREPYLREGAIWGLGHLGDPAAIASLLPFLEGENVVFNRPPSDNAPMCPRDLHGEIEHTIEKLSRTRFFFLTPGKCVAEACRRAMMRMPRTKPCHDQVPAVELAAVRTWLSKRSGRP